MPIRNVIVTNGKGTIILQANLWDLLRLPMQAVGHALYPEKMRVFFDGKEVVKPEPTEDDT